MVVASVKAQFGCVGQIDGDGCGGCVADQTEGR